MFSLEVLKLYEVTEMSLLQNITINIPNNNYYIKEYNYKLLNIIENQLIPTDADKVLYKLTNQKIVLYVFYGKKYLTLLDNNGDILNTIELNI